MQTFRTDGVRGPAGRTANRTDRHGTGTRRRWVVGGFLVAVVLAAAACGSSSPNSASGSTTSTTSPSTTGSNSSTSSSAPASGPVVGVASVGSHGHVLVDRSGRTLYRYTPDGTGKSTCTGGCASVWPPVTVPSGTAVTGPSAIGTGVLGTIPGPGGTRQVTFKGMPLYTYTGDTAAGQANGQGAGGVWFVVSPTLSGSGSATTSTTSAAGY